MRIRQRHGVVAAFALLLALAGCSSSSGAGSSADGGIPPTGPSVVDEGAGGGAGSDVDTDRDVIVTGYLDVVADDPLRAADDARVLVERAGGRLDGVTKQPGNEFQDPSARLVARIPTDELDATLAELEALGETRSLSTSSADVTQERTDLDSRIASLQASVDRLRTLLSSAATTTDLIAIETALSDREAQLESLIGQRDYLADQVDFSTITVSFTAPAAAPDAAPTDFFGAVVAGWNALLTALGAAVIGVGAALPWLAFLALLSGIAYLIVRRARPRRPPRAAPTPEA
ncbi:MAG: hypothetical protein JWP66_375 [Naasia sp.]|nr:hypothetical protein [Naasia sp.]